MDFFKTSTSTFLHEFYFEQSIYKKKNYFQRKQSRVKLIGLNFFLQKQVILRFRRVRVNEEVL